MTNNDDYLYEEYYNSDCSLLYFYMVVDVGDDPDDYDKNFILQKSLHQKR